MLFLATVVFFLAVIEVTFRIARRRRRRALALGVSEADAKTHTGVVLGALLGFLGLLLAFAFTIVEGRFHERKELVLAEANAIGTTYLRAALLPAPHGERARSFLRQYVDTRLGVETPEQLPRVLRRSAELHHELWSEAEGAAARSDTPVVATFITSLNELIDLHQERLTVGLYHRLPFTFILTLFVVATLAMATLGYSVGLSQTRELHSTAAAVVAVALVMMVIVEIDRPWHTVFEVTQEPLVEVRAGMGEGARPEPSPRV